MTAFLDVLLPTDRTVRGLNITPCIMAYRIVRNIGDHMGT